MKKSLKSLLFSLVLFACTTIVGFAYINSGTVSEGSSRTIAGASATAGDYKTDMIKTIWTEGKLTMSSYYGAVTLETPTGGRIKGTDLVYGSTRNASASYGYNNVPSHRHMVYSSIRIR